MAMHDVAKPQLDMGIKPKEKQKSKDEMEMELMEEFGMDPDDLVQEEDDDESSSADALDSLLGFSKVPKKEKNEPKKQKDILKKDERLKTEESLKKQEVFKKEDTTLKTEPLVVKKQENIESEYIPPTTTSGTKPGPRRREASQETSKTKADFSWNFKDSKKALSSTAQHDGADVLSEPKKSTENEVHTTSPVQQKIPRETSVVATSKNTMDTAALNSSTDPSTAMTTEESPPPSPTSSQRRLSKHRRSSSSKKKISPSNKSLSVDVSELSAVYERISPVHAQLEAETETLVRSMERQATSNELQMSSRESQHTAALEALTARHEVELSRMTIRLESDNQKLQDEKENTIKSLEKCKEELELERKTSKEQVIASAETLLKMETKWQEKLVNVTAEHTLELASCKEAHTVSITQMQEAYAVERAQLATTSATSASVQTVVDEVRAAAVNLQELQSSLTSTTHHDLTTARFEEAARVKLLGEMEKSAKSYASGAQEECARLTSLLLMLENTTRIASGAHVEEKERLRLEHVRLHDLAVSMSSTETVWKEGVQLERKAVETERQELLRERDRNSLRFERERQRTENERNQLDVERNAFHRACQEAENTKQLFYEKESRQKKTLDRKLSIIQEENAKLDEKLRRYLPEMQELTTSKEQHLMQKNVMEKEKEQLMELAKTLQTVSEEMTKKEQTFKNDVSKSQEMQKQFVGMKESLLAEKQKLQRGRRQVAMEQQRVEKMRYETMQDKHSAMTSERGRYQPQPNAAHLAMQLQMQQQWIANNPVVSDERAPPVYKEFVVADPSGLDPSFRKSLDTWWNNDRFNAPEAIQPPPPMRTRGVTSRRVL